MYKLRTKITLFAEIGNLAAIIISRWDALARHKKRVPDTLGRALRRKSTYSLFYLLELYVLGLGLVVWARCVG